MAKGKHSKKPNKKPQKPAGLYEGFSKCLEGGHISKDSFDVEGKNGISKLHACSQCGLMYWEK